MPYSDDIYSAWDGDESEFDEAGNQDGSGGLETSFQHGFHRHGGDGDAPGSGSGFGFVSGDVHVDDDDVLSPTDGYFRSSDSGSHIPSPPRVPNILVQDPSLPPGSTAESKAREAREESLGQQYHAHTSTTTTTHRPRSAGDTYHLRQPSSSSLYGPPGRLTTTTTPFRPLNAAPQVPHHHHRVAYDERSPFVLPGEAPPAYTPSPISSSTTTSPVTGGQARNYSTFSPTITTTQQAAAAVMGRDSESQGLLANEPQSMGGNPDDYVDDGSAESSWRERVFTNLRQHNWAKLRMALIGVVLLLVTIGFLTAGISSATGSRHNNNNNGIKEPGTQEPITTNPQEPDQPHMEYPDLDNGPPSLGSQLCRDTPIVRDTQRFDLSFGPDKKFEVVQNVTNTPGGGHNVNVHGHVVFRRIVGPDSPGPSAVVEIAVNDDRIDVATDFFSEPHQGLVITVPRGIDPWPVGADRSWPCVSITVTVWVPDDGLLESLSVRTVHLGISLLDNLSLSITDRARLSTVVGPIVAAATGSEARDRGIFDVGAPDSFALKTRIIEVETTSGTIQGSWPLYDYLAIHSTSGNIRVCIEPKEVDLDAPRPATLYIKSLSGTVEFREPVHAAAEAFALRRVYEGSVLRAETVLPPRDYAVTVHTTSGNIRGYAAFSTVCVLRTTSGRVAVELLPVLSERLAEEGWSGKKAVLRTSSTSGTNDITVLAPLWVDKAGSRYVDLSSPPAAALPPKERERYVPIGGGDPYKLIPGRRTTQEDPGQSSSEKRDAVAVGSGGGGGQGVAERALRNIVSEHTTTSATIRLRYPAVWEGEATLVATSGKLSARGEGVQIIRRDEHAWKKVLVARKGLDGDKEDGGKIAAQAVSGNIEFVVGE
ncbi:hypothetical protein QBC47DRAFT_402768 [Echria macrotheca]|uniref:Uncharacterized protein n=1 Tax=Echria macrotheca TaxID=438768 RepID=A0AAJ0B9V2_9PEZI|nr:hypothetical protein QBC47DRAFT_402768 [Echria macrotheca]